MGEGTIALDVFGPRGAFINRTLLGGAAPSALSIGSTAHVSIPAGRVLPLHGHVAFYGSTFHAKSANGAEPLFADGLEVPTAWTAYDLPCTLSVGEAFIHVNRAEHTTPRSTEPAILPSTIKDPWAIIGRAPNAARLRVPPTFSTSWSAPLPSVPQEETIEVPVRPSRVGLLFGLALGLAFLGGYFAFARARREPAGLVVAAEQAPPAMSSVRAAGIPPPSAPSMRSPPRRPMRKHRP